MAATGGTAANRDSTLTATTEANRVVALISAANLQPPPQIVECIRACQPVLELVWVVVRLVAPLLVAKYKFLYAIYCVTPVNELRMIYGVALCFFGGEFCASIAAIECFRRTGGEKLLICLQEIVENMQAAHAASLEDDKVDQLSASEWYKHKVGVVLKAVNPDVLAQACAGLYQGFLGMIMSLKFKFAWTVALACSIADRLRKPVSFVVTPILVHLLPKEYHKWINQIVNFTLKAFAVHMAWKLQMAISAVQSGLMGGGLVGAGLIHFMMKTPCMKGRTFDPEKHYIDEALGLPIAFMGIWFQLSHGFSLPFPFNIALLPLTIVEEVLRFCITWFPVTDSFTAGP